MNPIIKCVLLFLFCFALISFLCWKLSGSDVVIDKQAEHIIKKVSPYAPYKVSEVKFDDETVIRDVIRNYGQYGPLEIAGAGDNTPVRKK